MSNAKPPNAILLAIRHSERPRLQPSGVSGSVTVVKQGLIVPEHPCNTGLRPLLIGSASQVEAQMEYLFRGNYGLASREELIEAGVVPAQADEPMRMKLAFAFGRIMPTEELIEPLIVARTGRNSQSDNWQAAHRTYSNFCLIRASTSKSI